MTFDSLKSGEFFLMDSDCHAKPETIFVDSSTPTEYDLGTDSYGTSVKRISISSKYDINKRIWTGKYKYEITTIDGKVYKKEFERLKHIPSLEQMLDWIEDVGFKIIYKWGDHYKNSITENTNRLMIWAQKPE